MKYGKIFSNKAYRFISIRSAACRTSYYCAKLRVLWDRPREGRLRRLQQPIIDLRTPTHKFPRNGFNLSTLFKIWYLPRSSLLHSKMGPRSVHFVSEVGAKVFQVPAADYYVSYLWKRMWLIEIWEMFNLAVLVLLWKSRISRRSRLHRWIGTRLQLWESNGRLLTG